MTVKKTNRAYLQNGNYNRGVSLAGNQKPAPVNVRPPCKPAARPVGVYSNPASKPKG